MIVEFDALSANKELNGPVLGKTCFLRFYVIRHHNKDFVCDLIWVSMIK